MKHRAVIAAGLLCAALCAGCAPDRALRLGWVNVEPSAEIGEHLLTEPVGGVTFTGQAYAGQDELLAALEAGELDFALVENPPRPLTGVTAVSALFPSVLHVLVRHNDTACMLADLQAVAATGKVYAGPAGSTGERLLEQLASTGLLPPVDDMQRLDNVFGAAPDLFFVFGGILSQDAVSRLGGYCLVSLDALTAAPEATIVAALAVRYPQLEPFILPRGLYPQLTSEPTLTVAVQTLLVAREELPEDTVFDVATSIRALGATFGQIYPLAQPGLHRDLDERQLAIPIHPGAMRFLNRDAPSFLERYAEVMALLVTLLVAVASASLGVARLRRQAKKDRLDRYFGQLMQARTAFVAGKRSAEETRAEAEALQGEVMRLVVEERVSADSALVSFLLLANKLIDEAS